MIYYSWENKRRDGLSTGERKENSEFLDLTDRENKEFRVNLIQLLIHCNKYANLRAVSVVVLY